MTRKFIFADTSVLLNFICAGEQDLLLKFVGDEQLHVPQAVKDEVERKLEIPYKRKNENEKKSDLSKRRQKRENREIKTG